MVGWARYLGEQRHPLPALPSAQDGRGDAGSRQDGPARRPPRADEEAQASESGPADSGSREMTENVTPIRPTGSAQAGGACPKHGMEGVYGGSIGGGEMKVFCSLCDAEKASPPSATEAGELARRAWADVLTKHRVYVGSNTALGGPILEARDAAIASLLQKL